MTNRTLLTAGAALAMLAGPAFAQTATMDGTAQVEPLPNAQIETDAGAEADVGAVLGTGALPGVGIGTTTQTETGVNVGPGGLQNGVGATGTMAPDTTGAAGTVGGVPGTGATPPGTGIPIETTPGVSTGN